MTESDIRSGMLRNGGKMLKLYTCYQCGFPFKAEEEKVPSECPGCGAGPEQYLSEPYNEQEKRRIHVDPPLPDPDWDYNNLEWHIPKRFPAHTRNGRLRRFVMEYDDLEITKGFYEDVFGWDIINTETADPERPLMYCATGPGNPNWEPRVVSFAYGFLKPRETEETGTHPLYIIEVDSIEQTVKKVEESGGRLLKPEYKVDGNTYAVIQDTEGNGLYLWETPANVTWKEPESQTVE